jgi:hypothetical protein
MADWLDSAQRWQPLVSVAAIIASVAVAIGAGWIATRNTNRSLEENRRLEAHRRSRKHSAIRSVLPLALADVSGYAERSAHALNELVSHCDEEVLPTEMARESLVQPLPSESLETLTQFIEYSDTLDTTIIEATAVWLQIHDSRLRGLLERNREGTGVVRSNLETNIIDAASIYALVAAGFDYARQRGAKLQHTLPWEAVRRALQNMRLFEDQHPRLYDDVKRREGIWEGPVEQVNDKQRKHQVLSRPVG